MSDGARQLFDPEALPVAAPSDGPEPAAGAFDPELHRETHPDVLSIGALYNEVETALTRAFPRTRQLWVRGEISHLSDHRSGHLYLDLVDPDEDRPTGPRGRGGVPTLSVKCWRTSWAPLRHALAKEGIELAEGMIVVLRGSIDLYRAKGEVSLILAEIDVTALLGRLAAQRARLLRQLEEEGLLRRNAALPLPDLPLHVGLVASPGTEGYRDFLGRLTESGFGFQVSLVKVPVQGAAAPASIARAVRFLSRSDCDVIAMVRGGGSRADLAAFDTEVVARAVAERDQTGVHRHRAHRRRDGGRPGGRPRLRHAHRVRPSARGGRPAVVGGAAWPRRPACWPGACPPCWPTRRPGTRRRAAASLPPPAISCASTASGSGPRRPR